MVIRSLEEAINDPHYVERGLFDHMAENNAGERLSGITVPVSPVFRADPAESAPGARPWRGPSIAARRRRLNVTAAHQWRKSQMRLDALAHRGPAQP